MASDMTCDHEHAHGPCGKCGCSWCTSLPYPQDVTEYQRGYADGVKAALAAVLEAESEHDEWGYVHKVVDAAEKALVKT